MLLACSDGEGPTGCSGDTGAFIRELSGTLLCRQWYGVIAGSEVDSGPP